MRKIREVLRLHFACGLSKRRIARAVGIGPTAAGQYIARARRAGLDWPLPTDFDDAALERLLFPPAPQRRASRPEPEWAVIHLERRRPGVTLSLLWEEYRARHPDGYGYSWFCECYRGWAGRLSPTMRQTHVAGEKMFVDYAGRTVEVIDGRTGEVRQAQIFVAVLGASNYSYAQASWTQALPDWVGAHVNALHFFGGAPRQTICDNLKAGVIRISMDGKGRFTDNIFVERLLRSVKYEEVYLHAYDKVAEARAGTGSTTGHQGGHHPSRSTPLQGTTRPGNCGNLFVTLRTLAIREAACRTMYRRPCQSEF
jgi:hypothetical protein